MSGQDVQPSAEVDAELPPLPEPIAPGISAWCQSWAFYTEDQMHAYARAAIAANVQPKDIEPSRAKQVAEIMLLVGQYWDAAYVEGKEGRSHDTEDGRAQVTLTAIYDALKRLAATRAPAPAHEPVAWVVWAENGNCIMWSTVQAQVQAAADKYGRPLTALYAAPPQAPAVAHELTDPELERMFCERIGIDSINPEAVDTQRACLWFRKGYRAAQAGSEQVWSQALEDAVNALEPLKARWFPNVRDIYVVGECTAAIRALASKPPVQGSQP